MVYFLDLDLDKVAVDLELVGRVPYKLALYYLALPLAQENGRVTVALAHPENSTALATLRDVLHAEIVPVRSHAGQLRTAIQRLYGIEGIACNQVLGWSATPEQVRAVQQMAASFTAARGTSLVMLPAGSVDMEDALSVARASQASLIVLSPPAGRPLSEVISRCATSLILVPGDYRPVRRILVAARGYASDDQLLDWLTPLARTADVQVVLLPLMQLSLDLDDLLCLEGPAKQHLDHLLQRLNDDGVSASLHMRSGDPTAQIVAELSQATYDLLVIAAEAHGQFVTQVINLLEQQAVHQDRPIFVLKPADLPVNGGQSLTSVRAARPETSRSIPE